MKKNQRKSSEATKATKARKEAPAATVVSIVPKAKEAKPATRKFNGDWSAIPSSRQLLALVIRAYEAGYDTVTLPTTRDAAREALGYDAAPKEVAATG